jgi:hypothetical protein
LRWNTERIWVRESGCVKTDNLVRCTGRVNAVLNLYGGLRTTQTFFESPAGGSFSFTWAALALVLVADEEALVQFSTFHSPTESAGLRQTLEDSVGFQQCDFFVMFCHVLLHYWTPWTPADSGRIRWTTNSILSIEGALMITY